MILIPTVRSSTTPVPDFPSQVLPALSLYEIILPTNSDRNGGDRTAGVLRYDASDVSGSQADDLYPINNFTYRYFYVERAADGVDEVVCRAPISGSPTSANPPDGGANKNDHTRVEMRQRTPGPAGHVTGSKGDFQLSEGLVMRGLCRPMRFPDRDNTGSTTNPNNLTLMQLQPTDGTDDAGTTFVILALRKSGRLEATMRNADKTDAAPGDADLLLSNVDLGDIIWWEVTTSTTQLTWRAENRTKAPGTIITKVIPVPDVTAFGVNQRTRYHAHKFGAYHGTNVAQSSDDIAGKRVAGVMPFDQVTDYAEVRYRELTVSWLT